MSTSGLAAPLERSFYLSYKGAIECEGALEPIEIQTAAGRKQAIHFGHPDRPLFGFYHPPDDHVPRRAAGVVLCNPIGTDQTRSDRTYRHLAERLTAAGFACLRFDFFGTGDSGGDLHASDLIRSWSDDVGLAVDELRERSGAETIALVGLRFGATLALLHAAERGDIDSLVLWSPCVSGAGFVSEITKLHKIYLRIEPQMAEAPPPRTDGEEALGLFLPRPLVEDLSQLDVLQSQRRPARRTLVVDGGSLQGRDALMAHLRDVGAAPELRTHLGHKFLITVSHRALVPEEVIHSIVEWLQNAHPTSAAGTLPEARTGRVLAPSAERPILFGKAHPIFGLFTPAAKVGGTSARTNRPMILLANAGCVNRVGPHRMYVTMARRWAQLGFDVLRMDLSGIGDSPAAPGALENLTYPTSGFEDIGEAMHAVGASRTIVAGLCSGGDYAFQLGARGHNIAGAWMLNPRTFCVLDLVAVESGDGAPPLDSVDDVPRTLREMAERGVETFLLVSRKDPGVAYVDAHAPDGMRALEGVSGFRRVDLVGADHTFTPTAMQYRVSDWLTERALAGS
jgi:alpha-beta hydrolase superfamily lysophospholipase